MQKKLKNKKNLISGFTLIETLFGVAIFVLIVGVLTLFSKNVWVYNSFISIGFVNTDNGRQMLKTIVSEIRTASSANTGAYAISQATSSSFTFYSDINNDNLKEKVRYFLSGNLLQKGFIQPTGSPLAYNSANEKISTLASNVTSITFNYYDKNYDGTTAALSSPINIPNIRLVKITVTISQNSNNSPAPMTFSTQVSIRNLKDNL